MTANLQVGPSISATYTFEVAIETPPEVGSQFKDPRGNTWVVRDSRRSVAFRTDRLPSQNYWDVTLASNHPAHKIEPGECLTRLWSNTEIISFREEILNPLADKDGFEAVGVGPKGDCLIVWVNSDNKFFSVPFHVKGMPVEVKGAP